MPSNPAHHQARKDSKSCIELFTKTWSNQLLISFPSISEKCSNNYDWRERMDWKLLKVIWNPCLLNRQWIELHRNIYREREMRWQYICHILPPYISPMDSSFTLKVQIVSCDKETLKSHFLRSRKYHVGFTRRMGNCDVSFKNVVLQHWYTKNGILRGIYFHIYSFFHDVKMKTVQWSQDVSIPNSFRIFFSSC